jgi:hypothetical protein
MMDSRIRGSDGRDGSIAGIFARSYPSRNTDFADDADFSQLGFTKALLRTLRSFALHFDLLRLRSDLVKNSL